MAQTYETKPINPLTRMDEIGPIVTRGGNVVVGTDVGEVFKVLFVTTGGSITILGIDGNTFTVQAQDNSAAYVLGTQVTAATATGITWGGGI